VTERNQFVMNMRRIGLNPWDCQDHPYLGVGYPECIWSESPVWFTGVAGIAMFLSLASTNSAFRHR
jgi:hypothetical protein